MVGLAAAYTPTLVESPVLSLVSPVPTGSGAHTWHSSRGSPSPLLNQMGTDVSVRGTEPRVIASGPTQAGPAGPLPRQVVARLGGACFAEKGGSGQCFRGRWPKLYIGIDAPSVPRHARVPHCRLFGVRFVRGGWPRWRRPRWGRPRWRQSAGASLPQGSPSLTSTSSNDQARTLRMQLLSCERRIIKTLKSCFAANNRCKKNV